MRADAREILPPSERVTPVRAAAFVAWWQSVRLKKILRGER